VDTKQAEKDDVAKGTKQQPPPEPISRRIEKIWESWNTIEKGNRVTNLPDGTAYVNLQVARKIGTLDFNDRTVRTVELIPRQSSLNVNDMNLRTRAGAFNFVLTTLFGFGSSLNVQRQREQFSQFVQQELYSSAFGKGSREFGWTFTPMPGTNRLLSGVRTTYAVVAVPEEASFLVLESNGCYFPRSQYEPNDFNATTTSEWTDAGTSRNCNAAKAFLVPIPVGASGQNDFHVNKLYYEPVPVGQRIVVTASGYNLSSQIGVLINGSPLVQSIGLAQPLLRDDSVAGTETAKDLKDEKVHGRIERVDGNQIVFSFEMPPEFAGTPAITLIAPGKSVTLNGLRDIAVNGKTIRLKDAEPMFGERPPPGFAIDYAKLEIFATRPGRLSLLVHGTGFHTPTGGAEACEVFVNGNAETCRVVSPSLMISEFAAPRDEFLKLTISNGSRGESLPPVGNPAFFKIDSVTPVSYQPRVGRTPGVMIVKVTGSGFTTALQSDKGKLVLASTTEATLTLFDPPPTVKVTMFDRLNGSYITIIKRPPPQ